MESEKYKIERLFQYRAMLDKETPAVRDFIIEYLPKSYSISINNMENTPFREPKSELNPDLLFRRIGGDYVAWQNVMIACAFLEITGQKAFFRPKEINNILAQAKYGEINVTTAVWHANKQAESHRDSPYMKMDPISKARNAYGLTESGWDEVKKIIAGKI
jgi:hypothetical protein